FLFFICSATAAQANYHYSNKIALSSMFNQAITEHAFPGACIIAGDAKHIFVNQCYGYQTYDKKVPDNLNSIFDLASLTKVVATTSAIMLLEQEGKIKLSDRVVKILPNFKGPTDAQTQLKSLITIKDLLSHTSGL